MNFTYVISVRSIYHFDPSNLPPGKLQMPNASPATSPLPVENANAPNRSKRNRINVTEEHPTDDKENQKSATENSRAHVVPENETTPELEVTMPEATKNIPMNSLSSPLSKVYSETKDNNLNRIVTGMFVAFQTAASNSARKLSLLCALFIHFISFHSE